jgi:hypothetical protein
MRISEFYTNKAVLFNIVAEIEIDLLPERIIALFRMGKTKSWRSAGRETVTGTCLTSRNSAA